MAIYVMLDAELHDAEAYKEYMVAAPQYIERHGGEYLCRGGSVDVLVGDWYPDRVVMLKFPARGNFDAFINAIHRRVVQFTDELASIEGCESAFIVVPAVLYFSYILIAARIMCVKESPPPTLTENTNNKIGRSRFIPKLYSSRNTQGRA